MSKLEVDKIDPQSGTDLELGSSGDTITIPSGATLDASNATTTLPANVVTTDGTQTLTNKTIAAGSNTVTGLTNSNLSGSAAISNANLANSSITINDTAVSLGGSTSISTGGMYKNIIINGDMSIAQRGTSVSSITTSSYNTLDRFKLTIGSAGTWTQSQSTDVPSGQGFAKSLKMDCTTANASLSSGAYFFLEQQIEGQNLQYLKKGTANAESTTLSFWVKSNKTGTYIAELRDTDNDRAISKSYTISSASTWEKKTITYDGDTSGAFTNDNNTSLRLQFHLGAGSSYQSGTLQTSWGARTQADEVVGQVNLADSTSNEWYITGVQLEAGTAASDFEFLPFDVNMGRCQRYYYVFCDRRTSGASPIIDQRAIGGGIGTTHYPDQVSCCINFPNQMRSVPSIDQASGTDYYEYYHETTSDKFDSFNSIGANGVQSMIMRNTNQISASHGVSGTMVGVSAGNSFMAFDAEL